MVIYMDLYPAMCQPSKRGKVQAFKVTATLNMLTPILFVQPAKFLKMSEIELDTMSIPVNVSFSHRSHMSCRKIYTNPFFFCD